MTTTRQKELHERNSDWPIRERAFSERSRISHSNSQAVIRQSVIIKKHMSLIYTPIYYIPEDSVIIFHQDLRSISGVVGIMNRSGRKDAASRYYIVSLRVM
jgi:hypothetical protein